ncbi:armadillo-type protein [Gorgonomyces haynaldii]|nr:armadillo-type protein [Gorgonomyces haynaldii]
MESLNFDHSKIQSADSLEKKEVFVLQWLSSLEKDLQSITRDVLKPYQETLEKQLINYLNTTEPKPSKPTRHLIAQCFNNIYTNGDPRTVFDTIAAIQNILNNKKLTEPSIKIACVHVVGCLTEKHGQKVLSLVPESCTIFLKFYKAAKEQDIPMRYETLKSLGLALRGASRGCSDQIAKDITKTVRYSITDKYPIIRSVSAEVTEALYQNNLIPPPLTVLEFENTIGPWLKTMEGTDYLVRKRFASLIASVLHLSQNSPPPPKPGSKGKEAIVLTTILSIDDMLGLLPKLYLKTNAKEVRIAVVEAYALLIRTLGVAFMETHYQSISKMLIEFTAHSKLQNTRQDIVFVREASGFLLREVIGKVLSETGQILAIRELSIWIKSWASSDMDTPTDAALVSALDETSALLQELGPAAASAQEDLVDPLLSLIYHPSQQVKLALAHALSQLALALPQQLNKLLTKVSQSLQRELSGLSEKPDTLDRFVGFGQILSALIRTIPLRPLFASYDDAATIFSLSTQILRSQFVVKDYRVMSCQAQVAWTLIGALMSLGPNFVKVHISQLLLIWKNVFPKIQPKDTVVIRSDLEWGYLLFSKDAALSALHSFIQYNNKDLVTTDVAKRIVVCLNNALQFLGTVLAAYQGSEQMPPSLIHHKLYERECLMKKRLFACFKLLPPQLYESIYVPLLKVTIDTFALDPEKPDRFPSGNKDGSLFIETVVSSSLIDGDAFLVAQDSGAEERQISKLISSDSDVQQLENLISQTHICLTENDTHSLYLMHPESNKEHDLFGERVVSRLPPPAPVAAVDHAIELFSILFPVQTNAAQETTMEQLFKAASYQGTKISAVRKNGVQLNVLLALIGVLKHSMAKRTSFGSGPVYAAMRDIATPVLRSSDQTLRSAGAEILGRLARVNGNALFINPLMELLVNLVVNNRDPETRAGAVLAMGSILAYVGGMAAQSHLKTVIGILHSLAADSHPLVHTWSLQSLYLTIESAGLMFAQYVNSSLSLVAKLYMSDTHELSSVSANFLGGTSNAHVYPAFGRILYALVGVIGPELAFSAKLRDICFSLYQQFKNDDDPFVVIEAIRCTQNFIMFAPKFVDIPHLVPFLQKQIAGQISVIRKASVTCLYQLTQRDPEIVLQHAVNLEEQLFALLDVETDPMIRGEIKDILTNILKHVAPQKPSVWIDLCKSILAKSSAVATQNAQTEQVEENDDGEMITKTVEKPSKSAILLLPRWRTQVFALKCLRLVIKVTIETGVAYHLDLHAAREQKTKDPNADYLVMRIADLIRLAFNSSTATVNDLRLEGLLFLKELLEDFIPVQDPELPDHCLLEQFEAQIVSALAPAFNADAHPENTALACKVCAFFIGSGITKEMQSLSRPVKLLTNVLDIFAGNAENVYQPIPNAQVMVKLSLLDAWATLHRASKSVDGLIPILNGSLRLLSKLWFESLVGYSKLMVEFDSGQTEVMNSNLYGAAIRDVTLEYYKQSWIGMLSALSDMIENSIIRALFEEYDLEQGQNASFWILCGLCVESITSDQKTLVPVLECLQKILMMPIPLHEDIPELLSIFDRLSQTEDELVQKPVAVILYQLISKQGLDLLELRESATIDLKGSF